MYKYKFDPSNGNLNIKTGFTDDMTKVKVEVIEQTPGFLHLRSTYPNGFIAETKQSGQSIELITNCPIVMDEDGNLKFDDSELQ